MFESWLNIRIWYDATFSNHINNEELINKIDFNSILFFSKKIDKLIKKLRLDNFYWDTTFKHLRLMALMVDLYIHFSSMPVSIYKWSEPRLLNKSFLDLCWYSEKEIRSYYKAFWSVNWLLYKWKNLDKVKEALAYLKENWYTWTWYQDVDFTLTSKVDKNWDYRDVNIAWNTYLVWDLSVRSWLVKSIKSHNVYEE